MDWYVIEVNWQQLKRRIIDQWGQLSDEDFDEIAGKRERLVSKLVALYGISETAADEEIDDWLFAEEHRMNTQKEIDGRLNARRY
jgi:uncharacterized protein YjbJ (UPF0337 family)